jgi:hypothetical protein
MMTDRTKHNIEAGVRNLLLNCADARAGNRVLLVGEDDQDPCFEPELCFEVAGIAESMGMKTDIVMAEVPPDAGHFPDSVRKAMLSADLTIFFSRLGDRVRFLESPGTSKKVMTYTLNRNYLGAPFATLDYRKMQKIHDLLKRRMSDARTCFLEADCGTRLMNDISNDPGIEDSKFTEFSLELFPVMIFSPINCNNLRGDLVLQHFLISTSTHSYDDSTLLLNSPVKVQIENSRMVAFEGEEREVRRVKDQLERASKVTKGDAYAVNSWHTGINPNTFFEGDPYENLEYWGTVTYGSPRYTHLHAAGHDPGDISIQLMDASIYFDDEMFWNKGKFVFLDRPEVQALLNSAEKEMLNSEFILDIGI